MRFSRISVVFCSVAACSRTPRMLGFNTGRCGGGHNVFSLHCGGCLKLFLLTRFMHVKNEFVVIGHRPVKKAVYN